MGGKSSKQNSWSTPRQPLPEIPQNMPNSEEYESSIKWQPPDKNQNVSPTYYNQQADHHIPNGTHTENSLYYNQSHEISPHPTHQISENTYANQVQPTPEILSTPTPQVQKSPNRGKKTPKSQEKKKEKNLSKYSEENTPVTTPFPDVHIPRPKFNREWFIEQLQGKKHLQESVYEAFPASSDEGREGGYEREEPHSMNQSKEGFDSNIGIYSNKDKAIRPLLHHGFKQHDHNASPVKTSRGNALQSVVDPRYPSRESEESHPKPTAVVQVLPSEPFEVKNLKLHQVNRGSPPNNNNYFPEPDYNEKQKSDWDLGYSSTEGIRIPEIDY